MHKITATNATERAAELAAVHAEINTREEQRLRELQEQMAAERKVFETARADADVAAEAIRKKLADALIAEFRESMDGGSTRLVTAFFEQPTRAITNALAVVVRRFRARALTELGLELWSGALTCCFADHVLKDHPNAVARFGWDWGDAGAVIYTSERVFKMVEEGAPAEIYDAFVALETALINACKGAPMADDNARARYKVKCCAATHSDYVAAVGKHDKEGGDRRAREYEASYVAPWGEPPILVPNIVSRTLERMGLKSGTA